ncbi:hypothetical protein INT46_008471 [Mucor plumbeus]|uniref:Cysteine-rich transmembrane CYSTM domain-containing protein n=1 Tax=Mucor plumbeus TaxID=97098 RepID=A0A8H7USD1_9FUNG|nr:hypothetical protein INT46_008471 [Mucor plumbeus]
MSLNEKISKNQLKPDRYYTPQVKNPNGPIHTTIYEPTPTPESVVFHKKSRTPKNESCCLACLLACFLCFAVKGDDGKNASPTPSPPLPTSP